MDPVRLGRQIRALRRRRGWRQVDLAAKAGFSRGVVAEIEQGRGDRVTVATLDRIARALGARVFCRLEWQGENLDRLLDADHARLVEQIVRYLGVTGWVCVTEASFSVFGERGSIDVLAYHAGRGVILVVEAKSTVPDVGGMLMTLDRKTRLAPAIARDRGWAAHTVARLLAIAESGTARRRIATHRATFEAAFPLRGRAMTRWLSEPNGSVSGLWLLAGESQAVTNSRSRVRARAR